MADTSRSYDLLPSNATQLERDMVRSTDHLARIGSVARIRNAKYVNIPDDVLPWLIYEYNLGSISQYHDPLLDVLTLGIPWQRIRGTPASIIEAISWLGYTPDIDEQEERGTSRWADYHLGFSPQPPAEADLPDIYYLATLSNPARSSTQRIYSNWDYRLLRWDEDLDGWSEGRMWSDHSGIRGVEGLESAQVSLMRIRYGQGSADADAVAPLAVRHGLGSNGLAWLWTWSGTGIYSDRWHDLTVPATRIEYRDGSNSSDVLGGWPATAWPDLTWRDASGAVSSGGVYYEL